jgi:hypothetical protein
MHMNPETLLRRIRWMTGILIFGLVLSGLAAIPLEWQLELAQRVVGTGGNAAADWVATVLKGVRETRTAAPFIFYGTDWLAFGHIVIAISFVGAWRDPVRNIWLFRFGLIACALVVPWALVFGPVRGIPWWHLLVDCSFGVFGAVPLWLALMWTNWLAAIQDEIMAQKAAKPPAR